MLPSTANMFALGGFTRNIDSANFSPQSRASVITGAIQSKLSGNVRLWPDPVPSWQLPAYLRLNENFTTSTQFPV